MQKIKGFKSVFVRDNPEDTEIRRIEPTEREGK